MILLRRFTASIQVSNTIQCAIDKHQTLQTTLKLLPSSYFSTKPPDKAQQNLKQQEIDTTSKRNEWSVVYRLPLVRWASAFNRLKIYQGAVTIAVLPASFILEQAELLPSGTGAIVSAIALSGLATLALTGLAVQNLIGFIYINRQANKLKFAYVDYWGRRQDILVDIDEIIPDGAHEKPTRFNFFQKIGIQNRDKFKLKLLQNYGDVVQPEVFNSIFF